ncbi:MAG: extracellular solute-binding protein [Kiritimatiellae bacterium]|nr:extracellular solute-binding protein [Kiritimatiellia bacterium]
MTQAHLAKYQQVASTIRGWIETGKVGRGEKIQSEDDLAKVFGMARMTVRKGLDLLVSEGWLVRADRRGTFVSENAGAPRAPLDDLGAPAFLRLPQISLRVQTDDVQAHQQAFWRAAFDRFSEANPQARAVMQSAQASGGDVVSEDLIATTTWCVPHYVERGLIRPLAQPAAEPKALPCFKESASHGVPFSIVTSLLAVNLDLLGRAGLGEQPLPATFDELARMLGVLKTRLPNVKLLGSWPSFPGRIAWNDALNTRAGQRRFPERVRPVFEALLALGLDRLEIGPGALPAFLNGDCVFTITQPHAMDWMQLTGNFRLACLNVPCLPGSRHGYSARIVCVSAKSANPEMAERLAHFLARREQQALLVSNRAGLPVYGDMLKKVTEKEMPGTEATRLAVRTGMLESVKAAARIEYVATVFIPVSNRILTGELGLDDGLAELARQTEQLHRGEIGWPKAKGRA